VSAPLIVACGSGDSDRLALRGTILTPDRVIADGVLVIAGDRVSAVHESPEGLVGVPTIDTGGIILPGLIDLHNHPLWSVFPRWHAGGAFRNREDWANAPVYDTAYVQPERALQKTMTCELSAFGELRAIVGGVTSMRGSPKTRCSAGLVRNLESDPRLSEPGRDDAGALSSLIDVDLLSEDAAARLAERVRSGSVKRLFVHVGEGRAEDPAPREEFRRLVERGLLTDRTVIIHGSGLGADEFDAIQAAGASLVWSPRSTLELYGETTSIAMALDRGIPVALAPDWSVTGSANLLEELNSTAVWSHENLGAALGDRELVKMATAVPAAVAGLDNRIGSLEVGRLADVLVIRRGDPDPYRAVVTAKPSDVQLVMIGGEAVYGAADFMRRLRGWWDVESLELCGARMRLDTTADRASLLDFRYRWSQVRARLGAGMASAAPGIPLAPIAECP
jgi:cytosine/adenosine deaminase-related metal-dependent hydrolase